MRFQLQSDSSTRPLAQIRFAIQPHLGIRVTLEYDLACRSRRGLPTCRTHAECDAIARTIAHSIRKPQPDLLPSRERNWILDEGRARIPLVPRRMNRDGLARSPALHSLPGLKRCLVALRAALPPNRHHHCMLTKHLNHEPLRRQSPDGKPRILPQFECLPLDFRDHPRRRGKLRLHHQHRMRCQSPTLVIEPGIAMNRIMRGEGAHRRRDAKFLSQRSAGYNRRAWRNCPTINAGKSQSPVDSHGTLDHCRHGEWRSRLSNGRRAFQSKCQRPSSITRRRIGEDLHTNQAEK